MRNLKLQMHISLDGYVTVEQGAVNFVWDEDVIKFCVENLENVDTILLGQHTTQEFINFWDSVDVNPEHPEFILGKQISRISKVIFYNTVTQTQWKNTIIINGDINVEINKLKNTDGKDILVYGGATLASSLIESRLVDEFYFLLSPVCFGKGL